MCVKVVVFVEVLVRLHEYGCKSRRVTVYADSESFQLPILSPVSGQDAITPHSQDTGKLLGQCEDKNVIRLFACWFHYSAVIDHQTLSCKI